MSFYPLGDGLLGFMASMALLIVILDRNYWFSIYWLVSLFSALISCRVRNFAGFSRGLYAEMF